MSSVPTTHLVQCERCELIVRAEGEAAEELLNVPTFCDRITDDDLYYRHKECKNKRTED